jgi:hypothetical protein
MPPSHRRWRQTVRAWSGPLDRPPPHCLGATNAKTSWPTPSTSRHRRHTTNVADITTTSDGARAYHYATQFVPTQPIHLPTIAYADAASLYHLRSTSQGRRRPNPASGAPDLMPGAAITVAAPSSRRQGMTASSSLQPVPPRSELHLRASACSNCRHPLHRRCAATAMVAERHLAWRSSHAWVRASPP